MCQYICRNSVEPHAHHDRPIPYKWWSEFMEQGLFIAGLRRVYEGVSIAIVAYCELRN